jgi:oligopeptide transport system permease protein
MTIRADSFSPLRKDYKEASPERSARTSRQDAWSRFRKNYLAVGGLVVLTLIVLFSVLGPFFSQFDYAANDLTKTNLLPDWIHPFGTDELGRDILSRMMYGTRISLLIGFGSVVINLTVGIIYGGISGYLGGRIDNLMQRVIDVIFSVPDLLYVILLMVTFGGGLQNIFIVLGLINWVPMARIVRGQVLTLREQEYVLAARALGVGPGRILFRHLLPNLAGSVIIVSALQIPTAIFMEAFLSFIGLGIQAPQVSLGSLVAHGRINIPSHPHTLFFPALLIALLMLSLNFIGDGLSDALNPKLHR